MLGTAKIAGFRRANRFIRFTSIPLILLGGWLGATDSSAMDRFAALSMIESGDDDFAHGQHTEVSRFQIRSEVWQQATNLPLSEATNAAVALTVAQLVAQQRCQNFEKNFGRSPTDFEFYVLWNSPAQINNPGQVVRERAQRFVNLVQKTD